ncbi:phosphatase PAP2 family protein [Streptomyces sp. NPDC059385]|uniref:phosphatase PAP2 family protein n=1 Tax=Streptomyces sp. NPDC059385 TaxID=3346817 RepID=UPI00367E8B18
MSVLLAAFVKDIVSRTRPPLATAVVQETGFSFPSRHTTVATALLLAMAYLAARRTRSRKAAVAWWAAALALPSLVASDLGYGIYLRARDGDGRGGNVSAGPAARSGRRRR